ncbi:hypothetical protein SAMN05421747_111105 [Parapedobacter composti]|uniref:Uncharacterized protein n=1 Tax=Parapedobacter composti TaxID=623281 RepID=A0A1I1JAI5_9SPHI|nr:hypothetical protein [Parapedobacter composti]SFC45564.1 hypothetical protein SAMN05421747_111105 [Parapedobacter composti]
MTEIYTKKQARGIIRKLEKEHFRLDLDDELFYDSLKSKMDELLRQPNQGSINKIVAYSKAWHTA